MGVEVPRSRSPGVPRSRGPEVRGQEVLDVLEGHDRRKTIRADHQKIAGLRRDLRGLNFRIVPTGDRAGDNVAPGVALCVFVGQQPCADLSPTQE